MFESSIALMTGASVGVSVTCIILALSIIACMIADDDRQYMDAPPSFLRPIWPVVRIVTYFLGSNLPASYLDKEDNRLQKNGVSFMLTAEEYFSGRLVLSIILPLLGAVAMLSSGKIEWGFILLLAMLGFVLPEAWVKDVRRKRDTEIIKALPTYLEYLTMCVDAGLNFSGALKQAVDKGPAGAMKNEFRIVLRDINAGQTRADALMRMEQRLDLKDVTVFIRAIIQAEKMGSSMKDTLQIQAKQRLNERFQRAEKMAMEAPVKLVIPLVLFIFPLTFVILLFPIVVKFMSQGF